MTPDQDIGCGAGRYGRTARVAIAVWLLLSGLAQVVWMGGPSGQMRRFGLYLGAGAGQVAAVAGVVAAAAVFSTGLVWLLGERVLARLNPWSAAALLLIPFLVAAVLAIGHAVSPALLAGQLLYLGGSLAVIGLTGYGGCEVAGIPMLLLRRRYPVYCALNVLDLMERSLRRWRTTTGRASGLLALAAGAYFLVGQNVLGLAGAGLPFDDRWIAVAFLPAIGLLATRAVTGRRRDAALARADRNGALAAAGTVLTVAVTGSIWLIYVVLTALIVLIGILAGIRQALPSQRAGRPGRAETLVPADRT